jgi:hypothetical protein
MKQLMYQNGYFKHEPVIIETLKNEIYCEILTIYYKTIKNIQVYEFKENEKKGAFIKEIYEKYENSLLTLSSKLISNEVFDIIMSLNEDNNFLIELNSQKNSYKINYLLENLKRWSPIEFHINTNDLLVLESLDDKSKLFY